MIFFAPLALVLLQLAPVPPPMPQVTADCIHPIYATDMLVCDDQELRQLDGELKTVLTATPDVASSAGTRRLFENQYDWFRRSRLCAFQTKHRACAMAAYEERLAVVASAPVPLRSSGQCRTRDGTADMADSAGRAVLIRDGRVIGVGLAATPAWRPFMTYVRHGRAAKLLALDGATLATCRLSKENRR